MSNVLDDFYLPLLEQEKHYLSKEYKLLKANKIDTAEFDGFEKDKNSGEITFTEGTEDQKKELYDEVLTFAAALPKDLLISVVRGGMNGFDFLKDLVAFGAYGNEQLPDDSVFKFIDERIEAQKKSLNELEKDDPLTTRIIGAVGQDAAFVMPIYKKMKSAGIPKQFALPASFALGSTLAFDKETSFMLDTDMIKGLKDTINLNEDSPAEELFDKAVQGIEFTGLGYAFNKLYPMIKAMRKVDVQKSAVVTAGSLSAGEGAKKIEEAVIDKKMENLGIDDDQSSLDLPDDNLIAAIGPEAAKLAVQYLKTKGKTVQDLKKLSGGTGRSVFELDDDQVIKIAKMQRGIRENMNEMNDYMIDSWRPKVFERGDDFVVVENVKRADNEVRKFLKPLQQFNGLDWKNRDEKLQDAMTELGLDDFLNYDLLWNDFKAARNWGKTKDGRIVLIDGGALDQTILDKNVPEYVAKDWQNILSGRRSEGMGKFVIMVTGGSQGYKVLDNIQNNIISE